MASQSTDPFFIGYESLVDDLTTLITSYPPPFIYINDLTSPRLSASVLTVLLARLADNSGSSSAPRVYHATVNGVVSHTPRLFYDTVLNALARWTPEWSEGCMNWGTDATTERWNENFDGFLHGLRAMEGYLREHAIAVNSEPDKGKRKAHQKQPVRPLDVRFVFFVERAERLRESLPELVVPLTRLTEISRLDLSVVFHSQARWENLRPPGGAAFDPFYIDIPPLPKEAIVQRLSAFFPPSNPHSSIDPGPYHPSLKGLHTHFLTTLADVCYPFVHDPLEIAYIAAARWPGFVQPILDQHLHGDGAEAGPEIQPPSEDTRMRLTRLFSASLTNAIDELYPRRTTAAAWAAAHAPEPNLLTRQSIHPRPDAGRHADSEKEKEREVYTDDGLKTALPRLSKFLLLAAFLASTNPAKSDVRMFGRGLDEKKRKRRMRKVPTVGPAKIPQRLLGPLAFPFDRLLAILGALLEENDADLRKERLEFTIPGEYTDMEITRTSVHGAVAELASMRLLHRTSQPDKIDGPPTFKCGVSYDVALTLARELGVPLNDLMWDPV